MRLCIYLFAILIISGCEKANNDAVKKISPKDVASLLSKNQTSFRTYLAEWRNGEKKIYSMNLSVQISTDELENPYKFHDWIPVQMRDQLGDSLILALDKNSTEGKKTMGINKKRKSCNH